MIFIVFLFLGFSISRLLIKKRFYTVNAYATGTTLNEKEEDEKGFEWINNSNHPRIYATTAVAEQNALSTFNSNTLFIPKDVITQQWPNIYAQVNKCTYFAPRWINR